MVGIPFELRTVNDLLLWAKSSVKREPALHYRAQAYKTEITIIASLCRDLGYIDLADYTTIISSIQKLEITQEPNTTYELPLIQINEDQPIHGHGPILDFAFAIQAAIVLKEIDGNMPNMAFGNSHYAWVVAAKDISGTNPQIDKIAGDFLQRLNTQQAEVKLRYQMSSNPSIRYFTPAVLEVLSLINPQRQVDIINIYLDQIDQELLKKSEDRDHDKISSLSQAATRKIRSLATRGFVKPDRAFVILSQLQYCREEILAPKDGWPPYLTPIQSFEESARHQQRPTSRSI